MNRAELIASLVTDKYSGFKDGDESFLESASDARLEEFRSASDARRAATSEHAKLETDMRNTSARLKVAEDKVKAGELPMSEDEFRAKAPASIKALLDEHAARLASHKASLVSALKDCAGGKTEDELKAMDIPQLELLTRYARVQVIDYSGRGLPVERNAEQRPNYAPPDPYAAGLKVLQAVKQ